MDDGGALDELIVAEAYAHLRRMAARIQRGRHGGSVRPTSLVHEVYERLARNPQLAVRDRTHLLAIGARAMRNVLADRARKHAASKRGGGWERVSLTGVHDSGDTAELVDLNDALDDLRALDPEASEVVELRFLGGLTESEIAEVTGQSERTVRRKVRAGRAWLQVRLGSGS
jgi:RNA polymerase sigma factor (TIGR02999 family)